MLEIYQQMRHQLTEDYFTIETAPWGQFLTLKDPDGNGWIIQQSAEGM